jgi:hypothetical protein
MSRPDETGGGQPAWLSVRRLAGQQLGARTILGIIATLAALSALAPASTLAAEETGIIEGTVSGPAGGGSILVEAEDPETKKGEHTFTEFTGHWGLLLPAGKYFLVFASEESLYEPGGRNYVTRFLPGLEDPPLWEIERWAEAEGKPVPAGVGTITVANKAKIEGVNETMAQGGEVEVTETYGPTGEAVGCPHATVSDGAGHQYGTLFCTASAEHTRLLPAGTYHIEVPAGVSPGGAYAAQNVAAEVGHDAVSKVAIVLEPPGSSGGTGGGGGGGTSTGGGTTTTTTTPTTTTTATSSVALPGPSTVSATKGGATVTLQCVGEAPCTLEITLTSSPTGHAAHASKLTRIVVGRARATIAAGKTQRVTVKFTRAGLTLLHARHGHIAGKLTISGTAGTTTIRESKTVVVKLKRR